MNRYRLSGFIRYLNSQLLVCNNLFWIDFRR
jgi:hypothetical protein